MTTGLDRQAYRRSRARRSTLVALASTVVFAAVLLLVVTSAPGWPRVRESFFNLRIGADSLPALLTGLWLNIRVVLIGPSGSGKSTLLRCVDLLEDIDGGQIRLDGTDISDPRIDADAARRAIGMVFQSFNLFPHMTALANVTLAPRVVHGADRRAAEARGRELLDRIGLSDKADAYPDTLSGGQQQRVAIARALAYDPRLLLLDEITSALDPELVGDVLELVGELAAAGRTIVMATHEMGFARQVADTVCFLDGGVLVESGPAQRVLTEPGHDRTREFLRRVTGAGRG